jgi:hypothetical protein
MGTLILFILIDKLFDGNSQEQAVEKMVQEALQDIEKE